MSSSSVASGKQTTLKSPETRVKLDSQRKLKSVTNQLPIYLVRLNLEWKAWQESHPKGFIARVKTRPDGTKDFRNWECAVPGQIGTPWYGGLYRFRLHFKPSYPLSAPKCKFHPPIYHPNVDLKGKLDLSVLYPFGWDSTTTVKRILIGIRNLLNEPKNYGTTIENDARQVYLLNYAQYEKKVRKQAQKMNPLLMQFIEVQKIQIPDAEEFLIVKRPKPRLYI